MISTSTSPRLKIFLSALLISIVFSGFSQTQKNEIPQLNNSYGIPENLWVSYKNKTAVLLEKADFQSFLNFVVMTSDGNMADMQYFKNYISRHLKKDFDELAFRVGKGEIANVENVKLYFASLQPSYQKYFTDFQKNREEIIQSQNNKRGPINTNPNPQNCGSPCSNPGFESGSTFWDYWSGDPSIGTDPGNLTSGFNVAPCMWCSNPNQDLITTAGGFDPTIGGTILPVVPPGGGNNALRLGDLNSWGGSSWGAARASISFTVSANNANFTYRYAVVLHDPGSGHTDPERPYFRVKIRDAGGNVVPCGEYFVMAKAPFSGFIETTSSSDIWYRPWTTVFVPLQNYIGTCITVEFTTSDCVPGGHFGYGYIDCACEPLDIVSSSPNVCGGHSVTLTAPPGGASYVWSDSATGGTVGITGIDTLQTATVTQAGTYKVVITSVAGPTCQTTLYITIGSNPNLPVAKFTNTTVCHGVPMQFTDISTPVGSITGWKWDFNNDGIPDDSIQNPTHTFPTAGTFPVTLIIAWGACNADTTINVTVNPPAQPVLTPAGPFCANAAPLNLTANTPGGTWSGIGITDASLGTFTPSLSVVGFDTVTYTMAAGACPALATEVINVTPIPVADAGLDINICTGTVANIGATAAVTGYSYAWLPATGLSSASISDPDITTVNNTAVPIVTTYTLTVSLNSCTSTDQVVVTVNPIPVLTITNPAAVCSPGTVNLTAPAVTAGSTGGGTFSYWTDAAATTPLASPAAVAASGTYYIKVTGAGGCTDINPVTVTVNQSPVSDAGPDLMLCSTGSGTIGAATVAGYTYVWLPTTGITSSTTISNPTVSLVNPGPSAPITTTYTVTTTSTATGCQSSADVNVIVNAVATVNAGSSQHVCAGSTITLAGSLGGSATSGTWSGGAGTFAPSNTALNAVYTPSAAEYAADSVILTLTTNDPAGPCTFATSNVIFYFYNIPTINFSVANPTGCPPLHCANFTDLSSITGGSNIISTVWDFGDGSPVSYTQNPTHCYSISNYYDVTLTETTDHGCSSSLTLVHLIHVFLVPVAQFNPDPSPASVLDPIVTLNNQSSSDVNYWFWNFGDGVTTSPSNPSPVHTYPHDTLGSFIATLIVHNADGCYDTISHTILIGPAFSFYIPNAFTPNGDGVNDYFFGTGIGILNYDLRIFDRWGNMIFRGKELTAKWDGIANDGEEIAQIDVYVWKVTLTDVFFKTHNYIGTVTLVK